MTKLQKALREAEEVRTRLSACLESLPDPGTINTPNERVRVETLLVNLRAFDGRVMSAAHTCANPKTAWDLKPLRAWRDTLISARQNFKTNIEELAGIADGGRRGDDLLAVKFALQVIEDGPSENGESPLLSKWLWDHDVRPEWGERSPFVGRGGLRFVRQRIRDVERRLTQNRETLESAVRQAETLLRQEDARIADNTVVNASA